jgi:L-ascorbate metabolism protein UlaG (beta-lactamase superfamily)
MRLTLIGHASVLVELDGVRILTDPLLRDRALFLRMEARPEPPEGTLQPDIVVLSHFHRDHYDPASLRSLAGSVVLIGPPGAAKRARRHGSHQAVELSPGDSTSFRGIRVQATAASHGRLRGPFVHTPIGFLISGTQRVYFAGDTDLFPEMASLASEKIDVALIPIGGWGPRLGTGHLDPPRAAEALGLIQPRIAIPIHWGSLRPFWVDEAPPYLTEPGREFTELAAETAPQVQVVVLAPGESLELDAPSDV